MGLDILLESHLPNNKRNSCLLSRSFCRLVQDLDEPPKGEPELQQLSDAVELNLQLLKVMSCWKVVSLARLGEDKISESDYQKGYLESQQELKAILDLFERLYIKILEEPEVLQNLELNYSWMSWYFEQFEEKIERKGGEVNFGTDVRNIIHFLKDQPPDSKVNFYFF